MIMKFFLTAFLMFPALALAGPKECKKIKIAIVDTGLDLTDTRFKDALCKRGHKNFVSNESFIDILDHGTHIAGLIKQYAGSANYCMLIYKFYSDSAPSIINMKNEVLAMKEAIKNGATIINFSGGGAGSYQDESDVIRNNPKVTFIVAAGNDGQSLDIPGNEYYPASYSYPNIVVVGALDAEGRNTRSSNYGKKVVNWELGEKVLSTVPCHYTAHGEVCEDTMSGTSQATAIFSGKYVAKKSNSCEYNINGN